MRFLFIWLALNVGLANSALADSQKVTLMTINMWGAGANAGKGIEETVAAMRQKLISSSPPGLQTTAPVWPQLSLSRYSFRLIRLTPACGTGASNFTERLIEI
jgi:hypothetical protein